MDSVMVYEFRFYKRWCKQHGVKPSNPESLKAYLKYVREEC